jgi:hypothetical protein
MIWVISILSNKRILFFIDKIKKYGTTGIYILKGCHTFLFLSSRADGLNLALVYVSVRVYFEYLEEYISEKV